MILKRCPTCNRTFSDEALSFCLVDGAILSAPYDPQATLVLNDPILVADTQINNSPIPDSSTESSYHDLSHLRSKPVSTNRKIKWYIYTFASIAGVIVPIGIYALINQLTILLWGIRIWGIHKYGPSIIIIAMYGLLGLVFSYMWPQVKWKWGIWLSYLSLIIMSVLTANDLYKGRGGWDSFLVVMFVLVFFMPTLGAYLGSLLSLRRRPNNSFNRTRN